MQITIDIRRIKEEVIEERERINTQWKDGTLSRTDQITNSILFSFQNILESIERRGDADTSKGNDGRRV